MLEVLEKSLVNQPQTETKQKQNMGLSQREAERRLKTNGENRLAVKKKRSPVKIFANQFHDIMVMILLGAMVISVCLGEYVDAIPILIIVLVNACLGFFQEYRCEKTLEKLEEMAAPTAKVYRDGMLKTIPSAEIVCGDVFEIEAGDRIPCDAYIHYAKNLACDESILTGEAEHSQKKQRETEVEFASLNKDYMVYMGTVATKGVGRMEAVATGENSQMGRVSQMLGDIDTELTPLQKKLAELGKAMALICIGVCILVFLAGVIRGEPVMSMLMTGITIAIAAIPEGLPATVTICLALAVRRMLKRNALVHKLHSVETLGCATVICSDKTGTITENKMTVIQIYCYADRPHTFDITNTKDYELKPLLENILLCGVLCNNGKISREIKRGVRNRGGDTYTAVGDPTETAILTVAAKFGITADERVEKRIDEIPFESTTRMMTVTTENPEGAKLKWRKGSADVILKKCRYKKSADGELIALNAKDRAVIMSENDRLAEKGLRVMGFSVADDEGEAFLGLMAMQDPPRAEAKRAVAECSKAGIKTVMITGDHKLTAIAVAESAGIYHNGDTVLTGSELERMNDENLSNIIDSTTVFARVSPEHKLRIVKAFKARGHICAMTGDGVNDAPAVKEASIGVSMGIQGTDVTRQAADCILLDDNFATLVNAVEEGRTIYQNIRKFVRYLISCNIGEVLTMLGGIIMGLPMILLPAQILLVNLVTDGLPAVALGLEPPEKSVMRKPPRKEKDSFFNGGLLWKICIRGVLIGLCTLGCFTVLLKSGATLSDARTGALITLVMSQLIHVFECRSEDKSIFKINPFTNPSLIGAVIISVACLVLCLYVPLLQTVFATSVLPVWNMLIALAFSAAVPLVSSICNLKKKK